MTLRALQPDAMTALDAAYERACAVVDADLLADVAAGIDQMLMDVARLDDDTVRRASAHFRDGGLADVIMASYIVEARTRLRIASDRLLGGVA